ncbi:MAG: hypothetical protein M3O61_09320 [Gemmatimonadota bacterium]|nr:hypothetical protein [Gemmatimonadota bacterium]
MDATRLTLLPRNARRALSAAGRAFGLNLCRATASAGIASTLFWTTGCYTYTASAASDIVPSTVVAAEISDAGRLALAGQVGPEVARIEGEVVQRSDTSLSLMVSEVSYLNGLLNKWQGQAVSLRIQDVKLFSQRRLSRSRTALGLAMVGGLVALALSNKSFRGIFTGGTGPDKPPPDPPES